MGRASSYRAPALYQRDNHTKMLPNDTMKSTFACTQIYIVFFLRSTMSLFHTNFFREH